jgi:hypothetical protein
MKGGRLARRQGQIIPRGDHRWLVRVYLVLAPETHRRRYLNRTVGGSLHAAQHVLNTHLAACAEGKELVGALMTLNQYLDRWLELAARPKLRTKSLADYESLLCRHIRPTLGERMLSDVTPLDLQSAYQLQRRYGFISHF